VIWTKILVIIRRQHWSNAYQNFGLSFAGNIGLSFAKILAIIRRQHWSLVRQNFGRWFAGNIGRSLIFEVLNIY